MLMLATDKNLMTLLSNLGFESTGPDEIEIDRFDHWTNPDNPAGSMAATLCSVHFGHIEQPEKAAA